MLVESCQLIDCVPQRALPLFLFGCWFLHDHLESHPMNSASHPSPWSHEQVLAALSAFLTFELADQQDFLGQHPQARESLQRAIDRLRDIPIPAPHSAMTKDHIAVHFARVPEEDVARLISAMTTDLDDFVSRFNETLPAGALEPDRIMASRRRIRPATMDRDDAVTRCTTIINLLLRTLPMLPPPPTDTTDQGTRDANRRNESSR